MTTQEVGKRPKSAPCPCHGQFPRPTSLSSVDDEFFPLIDLRMIMDVLDVYAAAELLVDREVDVVLLDLVAQLVHVEEAHVPRVQAAEVPDAFCGKNI